MKQIIGTWCFQWQDAGKCLAVNFLSSRINFLHNYWINITIFKLNLNRRKDLEIILFDVWYLLISKFYIWKFNISLYKISNCPCHISIFPFGAYSGWKPYKLSVIFSFRFQLSVLSKLFQCSYFSTPNTFHCADWICSNVKPWYMQNMTLPLRRKKQSYLKLFFSLYTHAHLQKRWYYRYQVFLYFLQFK